MVTVSTFRGIDLLVLAVVALSSIAADCIGTGEREYMDAEILCQAMMNASGDCGAADSDCSRIYCFPGAGDCCHPGVEDGLLVDDAGVEAGRALCNSDWEVFRYLDCPQDTGDDRGYDAYSSCSRP